MTQRAPSFRPRILATAAVLLCTALPATAQDLVVDGSLCVGLDCPANPAFGFDTIKMLENNLRIHFDDTSTASSFPRNDWELTANDSANGGMSYLGITDRTAGRRVFAVEAGAPSNAMFVDDGGRLGLGTATPSVEIHTIDGDTPTLRLQQDNTSGFAPQTWDVAGNETNFFVRDVTSGSTLPFRIRPGAPSNSIFIDPDGNVGVGSSSPEEALHVNRTGATETFALIESGTGDAGFRLEQAGVTPVVWEVRNQANSGRLNIGIAGGNTPLKIDESANNNLLKIGKNGDPDVVEVTGRLLVNSTELAVPDYVFEAGYDLPSLAQIEAFIADNGHLPGVPSAREVAQNGAVDMTRMQMAQLEKIEELTLHTIAQDKIITAQEARIARLEDLVTSLATD